MNVEILNQIIVFSLEIEQKHRIQKILSSIESNLSHLTSNPQDVSQQTDLANNLAALSAALASAEGELDPRQVDRLREIDGEYSFSTELAVEVRRVIAENTMTPSVARDRVSELSNIRSTYLQTLRNVTGNLDLLGFSVPKIQRDEIQIGFQIPREIFHNDLDDFINTLKQLQFVVKVFGEVSEGSAPEIKVGDLSSSDPLIFLGVPIGVVFVIAKTITWALDRWKQVEEIRKLRAETRKIEAFSEEEVKKFFDDKIMKQVDEAIKAKVAELLKDAPVAAPRKNELKKALDDALRTILAYVERGVTLEIRMLPPDDEEVALDDESEDSIARKSVENDIYQMRTQLKTAPPSEQPILNLPKLTKSEINLVSQTEN